MLGYQEDDELEKPWKMMLYIWLIHLFVLIVAFAICAILQPTIERESESDLGMIKYLFIGVLAIGLAQMYIMRKVTLSTTKLNSFLKQFQVKDIPFLPIKNTVVMKYAAVVLICISAANATAMFGVVLFIFSGESTYLYPFLGGAIVVSVFFRPRKNELKNLASEMDESAIPKLFN